MEVINHSKAAAARKRGGAQQAPAPAPSHTFEPLKLERVYGSGSCIAPALACPHPVIPGLMAYSCGAVVAMYDSQHKQQTAFYSSRPRRTHTTGKPFACLAFSRDGAYLAAGERSAQSPEILVWEVSSNRCLQALRGHKHGVGSVAFSHDGRLLVSTGESYDGQLCVWDWQAGVMLMKQHTQAEVQRACFTEELGAGAAGLTITTVGKAGHFKVWSLTLPSGRGREGGHLAAAGQASLTPRPANLKEYRSHNFVGVAVATSDGSSAQAQPLLYALTASGVLLTLRPATRTIDKSLSLQVPAAFALAVSSGLIACACAAGVVRLFAARTLAFRGNLPRPSTGRSTGGAPPDGSGGGSGGGAGRGGYSSGGGGLVSGPAADPQASAGSLFPDAVGCAFDSSGERLTVVYADRSLMVWDVRNPAKVTRMRSVLSHSGVVWSAALIPPWQAALLGHQGNVPPTPGGSEVSGGGGGGEVFGPSSVLCTCGADGTVRLWNVCLNNSASTAGPLGVPADVAAAAKVTRTLRAIIHAIPPTAPDGAAAPVAATGGGNRRYAPEAPVGAGGAAGGGGAGGAPKPVVLRCLRVSPCGRHLATGDARGNLRVFNLATLQLMMLKEAHDAEILSLDYSPPSLDGSCYLASGSRDMFVHVYDMSRGYELVGTCDAHGGAVTAVRFSCHGGKLALLSCSADKSVVFRLVQLASCGLSFETYHTERMSRGVLYDMAVDPAGGRAVAVGQDNQLRLFDVATGRAIRNFSGDPACGEAVSVVMDTSGHLAICSCADGSVAVYDVDTGSLLARGSGHAEMCTGAVLLEDHRGLVTVGGDGCALLWRLTPRLVQRLQDAAAECGRQLEQQAVAQAAALQQQRQHQQLDLAQRQQATPTARRRKAWDLAAAADGGGTVASPAAVAAGAGTGAGAGALGMGQQGGAAAGGAAAGADVDAMEVDEEEEEEEPLQVHVDFSSTIRRVREGKPLLSLEKLPKWAQRTHSPDSVAAADPEGASGGHTGTTHSVPSDHVAPTTTDNRPDGGGVAAAAAALLLPPAPAGAWAKRSALPAPPSPRPLAAADISLTVAAAAAAAAAAATAAAAEAQMAAASLTGAAAASMAAVASQSRTWAEVVDEDDEIVFCDPLEDGPILGDPRDATAEPDNGLAAAAEPAEPAPQSDGSAAAAAAAAAAGGGDEGRDGAAGGEVEACPLSPEVVASEAVGAEAEPASGCASNRLGGPPPPPEKEEEVGGEGGDAVRRDLFREHFDSLGLDQASATKAPPPDPRRLSFTQAYRQARASSGAGNQPDGTATPLRGTAGGASRGGTGGGAAAAPPAPAAEPPPTTPFLSRLPLPPGINAVRGGGGGFGGGASLLDADGAVTSAVWTPERAMLPLTSPALAKTDKQLQELERIRLRLLSTLRKRQTNEEAALGAARHAAASTAAPAPAPAPAPAVESSRRPAVPAADAAATTNAPGVAVLTEAAAEAQQPVAAAGAAAAAAEGDAGAQPQAREQAHSGGGFLLPPPPAYSPVGPNQRANPTAGGVAAAAAATGEPGPDSPPVPVAQPSPGFSSLSAGTPMLGQGGAEAATLAGAAGGDAAAAAAGEEAASRLFVFNPIYGASPATPIMGVAAAEILHRAGLSPRGRVLLSSAAGDAGPASSPADFGSSSAGDSTGPSTAEVDDVIRAVLESEGGAAGDAGGDDDDATAAAGGVCVVTSGISTGKDSQRGAGDATPGSSPAKGLGTPRRSRGVALALPPMKPKIGTGAGTGASPAKSLDSAGAPQSSVSTGAPSAGVQACVQEPEHAAVGAAQPRQAQQAGSAAPDADAEAMLAQMQQALRSFTGAYRRLLTTMPAAGGGAAGAATAATSRFQAAARNAVAELSELLNAQQGPGRLPAAPETTRQEGDQQQQQGPGQGQGQTDVAQGGGSEPLPPAVVCPSPQLSQELLARQRLGRGRSGAEGLAASAMGGRAAAGLGSGAASVGFGSASTSSQQVVVEVSLVESMVEEKLQQRMQEEIRRMEEVVMARIMNTMAARQQQQQQ
ncbi:hypothetical protein PLESTB_001489800 [Pleodorina starrii]|uniref:Uncharacterized protein n=1 Tax=Pleodorina starrii TaxID=330485 RepID=A0A9W6F7S0_9CHLO|nr:hypothetical protein PLESTB_001489800 [Pleodorina starrii]